MRFRRLFRLDRGARDVQQDVDTELLFHFDMAINDLIAAGRTPGDARTEAERRFGDLERTRRGLMMIDGERVNSERRAEWWSSVALDMRYAVRKLVHSPGFTVVAVATLALAIGSTTAVFSIVNGVLLNPLPFRDPDRLVRVASMGKAGNATSMSYLDFMDYRAQSKLVPAMAAFINSTRNLTINGGTPVLLNAATASANYFDVIGVHPKLGREFAPGDDKQGSAPIVVLGEGFWRTTFGGDSGVVGRTIQVDGKPYTVVGVAPSSINFPRHMDAWFPLVPSKDDLDPPNRGAHYLLGLGRLAAGATPEAASAEINAIAKRLQEQYPQTNANFRGMAAPLREAIVGDVHAPLYVMLACVGLVLLMACANVANLLLIRATGRESEIAVRVAMGASRAQIMRQLVTESVVLSLAGAAVGTAFAAWVVAMVRAYGPVSVPRLDEVTIDGRVLAFTALVSIATGVIFGLVPAIHAAKTDLAQMLRESMRGSNGRRGTQGTRSALVVTEMALAVVLLVGAGLLGRSFVRLMRVDPGYDPEHVVTMSFSLPGAKYPWDAEIIAFGNSLVEQLRSLPGTQNAAVVYGRPLSDDGMRITFHRADEPEGQPGRRTTADIRIVSAGLFPTLGMRMLEGRNFIETDRVNSPPVIVVSEHFARKFFPHESAIGKSLTIGYGWQRSANKADTARAGGQIIGVVGDIKAQGASRDALETIYLPFTQTPSTGLSVVIRSTLPPAQVITLAKARLREIDRDLPVFDAMPMTRALSDSVAQPRFYAILLASFAGIALLLATIGIYGVISYAVSQRTRELGIRIALGASRRDVTRLVVGQGIVLTSIGVVAGLAGAFWLTRFLAALLFGIGAVDAPTFAAVATGLLGVACLASWIPARRAASVDPLIAMRAE
ncbi:MAG: Permease [Gemmatimonadetes bacterium]|nr:Permease [Gemmatimonadota bacterium]